MPGIFISYRRADSDGWAGRLRDALRARFGNRVFQDVESIADGEIFSEVIDRALQECDVALIIIGPNWASARDDGGRRLDQRDDWVRTETALVLDRKIRVIPVLVGGASMPRPEDLPEDLRSLTRRQAREIRSNSWDSDVALLTNHLRQIVGGGKRPAWHYAAASGAVLLGAIGVFAGIRFFGAPSVAPAPAEPVAVAPKGTPAQREPAAPAAPQVVPPPKIAASETPPQKQPAKPPVAPPRAPEPEQPKIARADPPRPVRPPTATPAQEARKPAVPQAETPPAIAPAAPVASPQKPAPAEPPAAATTLAHAALNLPNRPAAARELKIGDSWTYRLREVQYNKNLATVTHEIGGGDKGGIRETVRGSARGDTQRRLALEPRIFEQQIDQGATLFEFSPFMTAFSDLQPGVAWTKIAGATSPDSINDWRFSGKVSGRERVRVPAGNFEAIKAELEGQVTLSSPSTRDPFSETTPSYQTYSIWFVPEIGRAIKYERRTYNRGRRLLEHEQYELLSYKLN